MGIVELGMIPACHEAPTTAYLARVLEGPLTQSDQHLR